MKTKNNNKKEKKTMKTRNEKRRTQFIGGIVYGCLPLLIPNEEIGIFQEDSEAFLDLVREAGLDLKGASLMNSTAWLMDVASEYIKSTYKPRGRKRGHRLLTHEEAMTLAYNSRGQERTDAKDKIVIKMVAMLSEFSETELQLA